jgi:hypothetical protein
LPALNSLIELLTNPISFHVKKLDKMISAIIAGHDKASKSKEKD